jgi:methanethiol S-methyltransferase
MQAQNKYKMIAVCSFLLGTISLLCFFHFIIFGPFNLFAIQLNPVEVIIANSLLLIAFFTQHSLMIRKSIRAKIEPYLPIESFYAFHCICTSILLLLIVLFWQNTDIQIISIQKPYRYLCYTASFLAIVGLFWAIISLKHFDPFGRKQIFNYIRGSRQHEIQFTVSGPYRLTRHPFYFFILLIIWSHPTVSAERLLFNLTWTIWVVIGILLEEKDLQNDIGDEYLCYKRNVPMLIPYKIFNIFG